MVFRKLLVPLDGTPGSEHALPWALAIAERAGATLTLAHVHHPAPPVYTGMEVTGDLAVDQTLRQSGLDYLVRLAGQLRAVSTVQVSWQQPEGSPADELCRYAADNGIDLVVMTTHARGPVARFLLGSVADEFVRKAERPTLLIRPASEQAPDLSSRPSVAGVWVPLDGSELAEQVLEPATALARLMGAGLKLIAVAEVPEGKGHAQAELVDYTPAVPGHVAPEAGSRNALRYLRGVAERLRGSVSDLSERVVVDHPIAQAILNEVRSQPHALIALATHGRGLTRLVLGSVATEVIRHASCPVLVYRPR
jgi:nucleotide-binding universal stress UspA family protein